MNKWLLNCVPHTLPPPLGNSSVSCWIDQIENQKPWNTLYKSNAYLLRPPCILRSARRLCLYRGLITMCVCVCVCVCLLTHVQNLGRRTRKAKEEWRKNTLLSILPDWCLFVLLWKSKLTVLYGQGHRHTRASALGSTHARTQAHPRCTSSMTNKRHYDGRCIVLSHH